MSQSRSLFKWIVLAAGLLAVAIVGTRILLREPIHPDPQAIPSVTRTTPSPEWAGAVDRARRMLRTAISEQNLPGLSVAVGAGGGVAWAEGFGWADVEARAAMTPETRFRIGTASTALTSAAVGVLVEKGRLALDEEIQKYVPQYPKKQQPVTLRQLMAHVGGVGGDDGDDGPLFRQRCERLVEAIPIFEQDALLFEPGTQYRYSNYGWVLVSAAVESAAERPFLAFVRDTVFQPLGMNDTGAESAKEENPDKVGEPEEDPPFASFIAQMILEPMGIVSAPPRPAAAPATVYLRGFGNDAIVRYGVHTMRARNLSCYAGSMAFLSTPSDLARFGLALHGGKLLKPATVRALQTSQKLASGQETGFGLGWDLDTVGLAGKPAEAAGHDGELRGNRVVSLMTFREAGIVVAVTTNIPYPEISALALKVAEQFAQPAGGARGTDR